MKFSYEEDAVPNLEPATTHRLAFSK
eukprot:SAG31_NODE_35383_length_323_cov_1.375000_2_plen_25_part_01